MAQRQVLAIGAAMVPACLGTRALDVTVDADALVVSVDGEAGVDRLTWRDGNVAPTFARTIDLGPSGEELGSTF